MAYSVLNMLPSWECRTVGFRKTNTFSSFFSTVFVREPDRILLSGPLLSGLETQGTGSYSYESEPRRLVLAGRG